MRICEGIDAAVLYPTDVNTDEPVEISVAELVREAALDGVRDELPHSIAVTVDEVRPRDGRPDLTEVFDVVTE